MSLLDGHDDSSCWEFCRSSMFLNPPRRYISISSSASREIGSSTEWVTKAMLSWLNVDTMGGSARLKIAQWNGVDPSLTEDVIILIVSACASLPAHSPNPSIKIAFEESKGSDWHSMKCFPKNLLRPWPGFLRRPTLDHLFWHSHIVMTIILCQLSSSQIGHCGTAYFSHLVSLMFLCCFWSINSFVLHGTGVFYDPCSLSPIVHI